VSLTVKKQPSEETRGTVPLVSSKLTKKECCPLEGKVLRGHSFIIPAGKPRGRFLKGAIGSFGEKKGSNIRYSLVFEP